MLSIALAGCARRDARPATPAAIAVDAHLSPPADLLVCPARPQGFPTDAAAVMPAPVRAAAIRLAAFAAATAAQLERLIAWELPGSCATPSVDADR